MVDYPRESGAARQEIPSHLSLSLSIYPILFTAFSTIVPQHNYAGKRYGFLRYPVHAEKECTRVYICVHVGARVRAHVSGAA